MGQAFQAEGSANAKALRWEQLGMSEEQREPSGQRGRSREE